LPTAAASGLPSDLSRFEQCLVRSLSLILRFSWTAKQIFAASGGLALLNRLSLLAYQTLNADPTAKAAQTRLGSLLTAIADAVLHPAADKGARVERLFLQWLREGGDFVLRMTPVKNGNTVNMFSRSTHILEYFRSPHYVHLDEGVLAFFGGLVARERLVNAIHTLQSRSVPANNANVGEKRKDKA
jgi:hypothetical protein